MNRNNYSLLTISIFFVIALLPSCDTTSETYLNSLYNHALEDAMLAEESEIVGTLTPITASNTYLSWEDDRVLVVTCTKYPDSYTPGETITTWWGETWVTVYPEAREFIKKHPVPAEQLTLRIEQLLGLPKDSGNGWFAEMWVQPEDLFRPCPDAEITDTECGLSFPDNASDEYKTWFNNNIISSYFQDEKYPWTRLGYTYDWGRPFHEVGLSEFVIRKNAEVIVESVSATEEYFN